MHRRDWIKNAAGLFVAANMGIEVGWRRKFFPGANFGPMPPGIYNVRFVELLDRANNVLGRGWSREDGSILVPISTTGLIVKVRVESNPSCYSVDCERLTLAGDSVGITGLPTSVL